tara:strand:+ start:4316 stop:4630 length:315 start_codon:yes stop_codon:yes gene_type:complete
MLVANSIKSFAINTGIITMKTLQDLLELQAIAMEKYNSKSGLSHGEVFFSFAGHVNTMDVRYYPLGWNKKDEATEYKFNTYLTEDGIQAMYWWMIVNLRVTNRK